MNTTVRRQSFSRTGCIWALMAISLFAAMTRPRAQDITDTNALELRAREFSAAVSSGRIEDLQHLVENSFGPEMQKIPMQAHVGLLTSYWDMSRGLNFLRILQGTRPDEGIALFDNKLTNTVSGIQFRVEKDAPHRIVAVTALNEIYPPIASSVIKAPTKKLTDKQIKQELDELMTRLAQAEVFSGVVEVAKNGKAVFQRAYGEANREAHIANRIDTTFNVASMGKMFTAVAIAQLVEHGRLSYDDPLSKFVPNFPDADSARKIKIKHLLSHTSGLSMWWRPRTDQSSQQPPTTIDSIMATVGDEKLLFEPGSAYQYSNTAFLVLGKVIEQVSGQSFHDYVRANIFKPARMAHTSFDRDATTANRYQKLFDAQGKPRFDDQDASGPPSRGGPHGGAYSTVDDLVRFSQALRSGKLVSKEMLRSLQSAKPALGANGYGYGFDVNADLGIAGHSGGTFGVSDNFDMFVDSGWTAVVLSNYTERAFEVSAPVVVRIRELLHN